MTATISQYYQSLTQEAQAAKKAVASSGRHQVNIAQPGNTLKNALASLGTDRRLEKGITVMRITSRGVWVPRVITLSSDKLAFFVTHKEIPSGTTSTFAKSLPIPLWTPSKGFMWSNDDQRYTRHIDIADIDAWQTGVIGTMILEYARDSIKENQIEQIVTVFHHGFKPICFLVPSKQDRKAFIEALPMMKNRYNLMVSFIAREQVLLRYITYDIDVDGDGLFDSKEFYNVCQRINLDLGSDTTKIFEDFARKFSASKNGKQITRGETRQLLHSISLRDMPAAKVFDSVFGKGTKAVGPGQFREDFMINVQGENLSLADTECLFESIKVMGYNPDPKNMDKQEFLEFLNSKANDAYDPAKRMPPTTKLDQPISHYWINTSHNTYLTGDQLQSRSSVVAYGNALLRGCKCLELDCWDGYEDKKSKKFVPVVYHGHTITSKIDFGSIILVVDNYLRDHPKSYPIILSLENHCSHPYQRSMAVEMKKVFGKKLYVPTKEELAGQNLPSPEHLRGMVVIKGKRPPEADEDASGKDGKVASTAASFDDDGADEYEEALTTKTKKSKIDPELAVLTLFHGVKYKDFSKSLQQPTSHMHSIGETKITKILDKSRDNAGLWRHYNVNHMTRTYPAGSRVDSSNYNPVLAWAMGSQLVALNFQTSDSPLLVNDGRFRQDGGCGYLLKPASVMGNGGTSKKSVDISVLSAHCLPKPQGAKSGELVDPYIKVTLYDVQVTAEGKEEFVATSQKTSSLNNNGFCPVWSDASFKFEVHNPDVAMFLFKVVDEDIGVDDIICGSAIPVSCLRKGYRSVQLYDDNGTTTGAFECANVFVRIKY
ncbi:MAG: hypothetical protein SGILL_000042 [Bacillariaceae sp.]